MIRLTVAGCKLILWEGTNWPRGQLVGHRMPPIQALENTGLLVGIGH
jgi:hypothetical protein